MPEINQQRLDGSVEAGVKALADRGCRHNPSIPNVPSHILGQMLYNYMHSSDGDGNKDQDWMYWHEKYPSLDADTAKALDDEIHHDYLG